MADNSAEINDSAKCEESKVEGVGEIKCTGATSKTPSESDEHKASASKVDSDAESDSEDCQDEMHARKDSILRRLSNFLGNLHLKDESVTMQRLKELTPDGIADYIKSTECKSVVAMIGAGISTSAGIPDFRSPGSGIYANLARYNLPYPEAVFDISFFLQNPKPFYHLAKQLIPEDLIPTPAHCFLRLLHDKGILTRVYSQNIDNLESLAGLPSGKVVQAHGSFHTSHCMKSSCRKEYSYDWLKGKILEGEATSDSESINVPKCEACGSVVKPDIVFFGDKLPDRFFILSQDDFPQADLLIIIGTSLTVQPFASLIQLVPKDVPRLAINLTKFKKPSKYDMILGGRRYAFNHESKDNKRDVFMQGPCDEMTRDLAVKLGWEDELNNVIAEIHKPKAS